MYIKTLQLPSKSHDGNILRGSEVETPQELVLDVEQEVAVDGVGRSLALELEYDHAAVVAGREQAKRRMTRYHPVAIVLASKLIQAHAFGHVPHSDRLVLRVAHDELLFRVKDDARDVVVVAATRVHFPGFRLYSMRVCVSF